MSSKRVKLLNSVLRKKIKSEKSSIKETTIKEEPITDQGVDSVEHYVLEYIENEEVIIKTNDENKDNDNDENDGDNDDDEKNENDGDDDGDTNFKLDSNVLSDYQSEDDVKSVQEVLEHVCGKCFKSFLSFQHFKTHSMYCRNDGEIAKNIVKMLKNLRAVEEESFELEKQNICICCKENLETAHCGHIRCPKCPKSFKSSPSFERHLCLIHSDCLDYPCETCNAKCPSKIILDLHQKAHIRGKPFACKKCGEEFTRRYHLQRHRLYSGCKTTNVEKKILLCKVCGKEFYRLDNLRMHLKQHLGQDTKTKDYPCPYCGKAFYGTATLNIHIRTHTGERPFTCDLCGDAFPSNPALRKHRRKHTGERPYQCSECFRAFAAKEVLNRHLKTHTGEKPHECGLCGKRFIQATQLKQHLLTHQKKAIKNSRPCRKCKLLFNTKEELEAHKKEKCSSKQVKSSVTCNQCGKILHTEGGLKRHITRVHIQKDMLEDDVGDKKKLKFEAGYMCDICNEVFDNRKNLQFHYLKEHDGVDEFELTEQVIVEDIDEEENIVSQTQIIAKTEVVDEQNEDNNEIQFDDEDEIQLDNGEMICRFCKKKFRDSVIFIKHMEDDHGAIILSLDNNEQKEENQFEDDNPSSSINDYKCSVKKPNVGNIEFQIAEVFGGSTDEDDNFDIEDKIKVDVDYAVDSDNKEPKQKRKKADKIHKKSTTTAIKSSKNKKIKIENIDNNNGNDCDDVDDDSDCVLAKLKKPPSSPIQTMDEKSLMENISKLLDLLIDKDILEKFGYPKAPVEEVLLKVIKNCGHKPKKSNSESTDYMTRLRDYVKLLFTVVIDNDSIKELLNNHPVDKVICQVLKMAGQD